MDRAKRIPDWSGARAAIILLVVTLTQACGGGKYEEPVDTDSDAALLDGDIDYTDA